MPTPKTHSRLKKHSLVVYHLHGQTVQFMVWTKGKQNSGLVNVVSESCPFICKNQLYLPKNGLEGLKLVSKIALRKWNMNFRLEHSIQKNRTTFSDVPLLPEFSTGMNQKVVFHLLSDWIFQEICVSGKQPSKTQKHLLTPTDGQEVTCVSHRGENKLTGSNPTLQASQNQSSVGESVSLLFPESLSSSLIPQQPGKLYKTSV